MPDPKAPRAQEPASSSCTVFLLSPAHCGGRRAALLMRPESTLSLAARLAGGTASLGETFTFMSGLYFRGKLAYALAFGRGTGEAPSTLVITPTRGLQVPERTIDAAVVREFASLDVADDDARYREPLLADAQALAARLPLDARIVLLGSIATPKYVGVLAAALGGRLCFPASFVGRGDMSRGALLLRSAAAGTELEYVAAVAGIARRGPRAPRIGPASLAGGPTGGSASPSRSRRN